MNKKRGYQRRLAEGSTSLAEPIPQRGDRVEALRESAVNVIAFNADLLEDMRTQWACADWMAISKIRADEVAEHPDRGSLSIISAAASLQLGDRRGAREHAWQASAWNCDRAFVARVLLASARHALGRASAAAGRTVQAAQHFQRSHFDSRMPAEVRRFGLARTDEVASELSVRRDVAARRRKAGAASDTSSCIAWITDLVSQCLAASDLHDAIDGALDRILATPEDRVRFLMRLSEQFQTRGDQLIAVHYLNTAREFASGTSQSLRRDLARQMVVAGQPAGAMDLLFDGAMAIAAEDADSSGFVHSVQQAYKKVREAEQSRREHGHELLLSYLKLQLPKLRTLAGKRRLSMLEIGTTRESVPGQGSTRRLAEFCKEQGIAFVTVDMDPHNSRAAERTFQSLGVDFEAITMKGEDYLRTRREMLDFVFLDAYDFDHGKHSERRQSRYLKFLGSRIDEQACHQMHLDCAESVVRLLSPVGVVCIDDTWTENDLWTAKGMLAMPYLLEHGFELIDARNRAALLRRIGAVPSAT